MHQFVSYHVINSRGLMEARFATKEDARDYAALLKDNFPEDAPITIHEAVARPVERVYANSGTRYHPKNAKTRREQWLDRIRGGAK